MRVRSSIRLLYIVLLLGVSAPMASGQWKIIGNRRFSAFDMVTPHLGLAATHDVGLPILCKYSADTMGGIFTLSDVVTSIIAPDSNTAYFTVANDGLYSCTSKWSNFNKIYSADSLTLLAVSGSNMVARNGIRLFYSKDGGHTFLQATGVPNASTPDMTVRAVVAYSSTSFVAVTAANCYLSRDGGANWLLVLKNQASMGSAYCDKINQIVYVGGSALYRSLDSGWHWQQMTNVFFDLTGQIAGTHDCTGAFYLGPDPHTRGELLRSTTLGKFFQDVGYASLSSIRLLQMEVFDRGSTIFWLDTNGYLSVTRVGVDSTISDTVRDHLALGIDTVLHNSFCPGVAPSNAVMTIGYDQCTGIVLDSIKMVKANPAFTLSFKPTALGDSTISVPYTFRARSELPDSVQCRLYFHSKYTQNYESILFILRGVADVSGPGFTLSTPTVDFGKVPLDSTKKGSFVVTNTGCDTLVILGVTSSDPADFEVAGAKTPIKLAPGATTFTSVGFRAHEARLYLESVNILTNIGMRFVTLRGTGTTTPEDTLSAVAQPVERTEIVAYPNPVTDVLTLRGDVPHGATAMLVDALGRIMRPSVLSGSENELTLDLRPLASGSYMLVLGERTRITIVKY